LKRLFPARDNLKPSKPSKFGPSKSNEMIIMNLIPDSQKIKEHKIDFMKALVSKIQDPSDYNQIISCLEMQDQ